MKILIVLALLTHSAAFSLSLKEAEELAFTNDPKIQSLRDSQTALDARKNSAVAGLLPNFNLSLSKTYQVPYKNISESAMELRATFQNPLWHFAQQDKIAADKKLVDLDQIFYRQELLYKVRTSYFSVKLLELQIALAQKHLTILSRLFQSHEKKYKQGRIPRGNCAVRQRRPRHR